MYLRNRIAFALFASAVFTLTHAADKKLDEVIVTANRSPTSLGNITSSVTSLDAEVIQAVGATHHTELLNRAPGAMFQRNSGQESLTAIRSPVLAGAGSCGAFLFMEDSIAIRPVGFCNVNQLFEVNMAQAQAVEVLRGPAGSLYGSSAMHGAVNVLSMDPTKTPMLSVALEGGPDDFRRGNGLWSIGGDDNALALATTITHDGGWRDDSKVDEQKVNAAWHLGLDSSTLDVRLAYSRLDQDTAGFLQGDKYIYRDEAATRTNQNPEAYRNARSTRLNAHWSVPFSESLNFDLRPYVRSSRMEFLQHFLIGQPLERNGQDSGGVIASLSATSGIHSWLVGIDTEYADTFLLEDQSQPTLGIRPAGRHYDYTVQSAVAALYGRYEVALGDWRLNLGARAERVEYNYDNLMSDGNVIDGGGVCAGGCLYFRPSDRTDTFNTITPQLGASWRWLPEHMLYATLVRGYRAPESSELYRIQRQQSLATPQEERIDSIELGVRGHVGGFNYDVALFDMHKQDLILREANGLNLSNGKTKHRGVEYELGYSPIELFTLAVAGTWAKHTYDFTASLPQSENIVSGRDVDTAPRNTWNVRAQLNPIDSVSAELEWQHVGKYWVDAANANRYDGHNVLNLRASWEVIENLSVAARVINIADRRYADRADFAFGNYRFFPGRGRTGFLELRWEME
jgi:iron complex outermembrane receptor protein